MIYVSFFFFFKQKTAYEMRISDWSSDVCSSDLDEEQQVLPQRQAADRDHPEQHQRHARGMQRPGGRVAGVAAQQAGDLALVEQPEAARRAEQEAPGQRSAEHTSELQSLMRISYAVFCLKKKK